MNAGLLGRGIQPKQKRKAGKNRRGNGSKGGPGSHGHHIAGTFFPCTEKVSKKKDNDVSRVKPGRNRRLLKNYSRQ